MDRVKRRWWTATTTVLALVVVIAAVISGLFQLAVMALPGYREQLSGYVSRVANRPIDIGGVALVWHRFRPLLELDDIVIYGDDGETPALSAERLRIGFGLFRLVRGDTFPDQIELAGLDVVVQIDRDDQVTLRGFDTAGPAKSTHDWQHDIARFDEIRLADCRVRVEDARLSGGNPQFRLVEALARRRFGGASLEAQVELPSFMGEGAEFEADLDGDPADFKSLAGSWSLSFEGLSRLPWLEARLEGHPAIQMHDADLSVSGAINQGRIDTAELDFEAKGVAARRGEHLAKLHDIGLRAKGRRDGSSWTLDVPHVQVTGESGPWPDTRLRLQWTPLAAADGQGGSEIEADADYLRLQDLAPWMMLAGKTVDPRLLGVSGELRNLVARGRLGAGAPTYSVSTRLDKLGFAPAQTERGPGPGFQGLSGQLSATEAGGRLSVDTGAFVLDYGRVFAQPVGFERVAGQLDWTHDEQGWRIQMPKFSWSLEGSLGEADLDLLLPAAGSAQTSPPPSPVIKLDARFSAEDVTRLKPYKPIYWSENLRNWIDRGIVAGRVPSARLRIEGDLADFPFRDRGLFSLDLDVANGKLAYAPGWPEADQVAARLSFNGSGLNVKADGGRLSGNRIEHLVADIPQFQDAVLDIQGEVDGDAARYYEFLRASPLAPRLSGLLERTQGSGPASVSVHLSIPLKNAQQAQVDGVVKLKGAELTQKGLDEPFKALEGDIHFTQEGAQSDGVRGTFYGVPAVARLAAEGKGATRLTADMDYTLQPDGSGLSRYVPGLLRPHVSGGTHLHADVLLGANSNGIEISSDLVGVTVDLPPPVGKIAEESAPLSVRIGGSEAAVTAAAPVAADPAQVKEQPLRIGVSYRKRLGADVYMAKTTDGDLQTQRVLVNLGSDAVPQATEPGVRVTGEVADLDISTWLAAMRRNTESEGTPTEAAAAQPAGALRLEAINLAADRLHLSGYSVGSVRLNYSPEAAGSWNAQLSGQGAVGDVHWIAGASPQVVARFEKLKVAGARKSGDSGTQPAAKGEPIDPNKLPTIDADCRQCELGDARLGHLRVQTVRTDGGQKLSLLEASGADLDLKGSGEWIRRSGASTAYTKFKLDSRSIGPTLEGLGYARSVDADRSRFDAELTWPPAIAGVDWTQAQGKVDLELEKGSLRSLEPGAGRVLGLLNFYALPRRLTLDFRDVTSKGLGFDKVKGSFLLDNGNATSDGVSIDSPSLKIEMKGRVGLAARDYDQKVSVYPDVSGGVTLGALLLGGPAIGVLALLAQEVLDKPLDQVTQLSYAVTGSWDNPQVKRAE
jgi:uncharacterized protein (TIGR02099 family)